MQTEDLRISSTVMTDRVTISQPRNINATVVLTWLKNNILCGVYLVYLAKCNIFFTMFFHIRQVFIHTELGFRPPGENSSIHCHSIIQGWVMAAAKQGISEVLPLSNASQLLLGAFKAFQSQIRYTILPASFRSTLRSPSYWRCPEKLRREAPKRHHN